MEKAKDYIILYIYILLLYYILYYIIFYEKIFKKSELFLGHAGPQAH